MRGLFLTALLALLAVPAAADASRIELTGTAGPAAEVFPLYRAAPGERNRVRIKLSSKGVTIIDRGVRRIRAESHTKSPLCARRSARRFFCEDSFYVEVQLGDRNDRISFAPGGDSRAPTTTNPLRLTEPDFSDSEGAPDATTYISGGTGNDTIRGSNRDDSISPGPGRDTVDARGAGDRILLAPDGARDSLRGGGGIDSLFFLGNRAVKVDLKAGAGGGDKFAGFERVHGTEKNDTLLGSDRPDALYGEGGSDVVDGRGGNDLLVVGDSAPDQVRGGDGDDVVDASGFTLAPTSSIDCGPGNDREAGEADDLLGPSCESVAFAASGFGTLFQIRVKAFPVARDASGPTYEIPCPANSEVANQGCNGTVTLEKPPTGSTNPNPQSYGSGSFALMPATSSGVHVTLNAAGQAAVAAAKPVAVHVKGNLAPSSAGAVDFAWQEVLP